MTQTQTPRPGSPDPDCEPDPDRSNPDPGPDPTLTDTRTRVRTPGPDSHPERVRTEVRTAAVQTPDPDSGRAHQKAGPRPKIADGQGPGQGDIRTRTPDPDYPGGWFARRRARATARRRAEDEAIRRGTDAELRQLKRAARRDVLTTDETDQPARWERFAAGWPWWGLTIAVSIMASVGQIEFARKHGADEMIVVKGHDIGPLFAPAVFDFSVAGLYAYGMYVAVRHKASPWLAWGAGFAIGAFSVFTNTQHRGALFFASSSAVLLVSWSVRLYMKYRYLPHVRANRAKRLATIKGRSATGKPRLLTSSLVFASRATAGRAWIIARRRPIAACTERMRQLDETITERDLAIRAAELFRSVHADRLVAELAAIGDPPETKEALKEWKVRREQALARAELVAWDAVDGMLGIPVINRTGIQINQITYLEPAPPPAPKTRALTVATAAVPAAPALPAATAASIDAPAPRRRIAAAPAAAPADDDSVPQDPALALLPARPAGNAGMNWLSLTQMSGLPDIELDQLCQCRPDPEPGCGKTLVEHLQNRGQQVQMILTGVEDWDTRVKRIGKDVVRDVCKGGSGVQQEVAMLFDQLRKLAAAQRAARDAAASQATVVKAEIAEG